MFLYRRLADGSAAFAIRFVNTTGFPLTRVPCCLRPIQAGLLLFWFIQAAWFGGLRFDKVIGIGKNAFFGKQIVDDLAGIGGKVEQGDGCFDVISVQPLFEHPACGRAFIGIIEQGQPVGLLLAAGAGERLQGACIDLLCAIGVLDAFEQARQGETLFNKARGDPPPLLDE